MRSYHAASGFRCSEMDVHHIFVQYSEKILKQEKSDFYKAGTKVTPISILRIVLKPNLSSQTPDTTTGNTKVNQTQ